MFISVSWKRRPCGKAAFALAIFGFAATAASPATHAYVPGDRWTTTASGFAGSAGDPVTLTWSIVRDGLSIPGEGGSNLVSFLDGIFNVTSGGTNLATRPWFDLFHQSFDRWSSLSGINFIYEPNDSGLFANSGVRGVRGDIRIGGQNIDGSSGTLAYAFYPNTGDIVIDTSETSFFSNSSNTYRAFRNTMMHEIGHAVGIDHVQSSTDRLLMEPTISTLFDGPQLDDIRGVQSFYGDAFEKSNAGQGNDSHALAVSLGSLAIGGSVSVGADAAGGQGVSPSETDFVSIANAGDVDYYSFSLSGPAAVGIVLTPWGGTFHQAAEGETQSPFDASSRNDLSLSLFSTNGATLLATADIVPAGEVESLLDVSLAAAGKYFVRVAGGSDAVQLYQLDVSASPLITPLEGDYNDDGVVDAADYVVWRKSASQLHFGDGSVSGQPGDADYVAWREHFGDTQLAGGGAWQSTTGAPEPGSLAMGLIALVLLSHARWPHDGRSRSS